MIDLETRIELELGTQPAENRNVSAIYSKIPLIYLEAGPEER